MERVFVEDKQLTKGGRLQIPIKNIGMFYSLIYQAKDKLVDLYGILQKLENGYIGMDVSTEIDNDKHNQGTVCFQMNGTNDFYELLSEAQKQAEIVNNKIKDLEHLKLNFDVSVES